MGRLERVRFLRSAEGREAIEIWRRHEGSYVSLVARLRRRLSPEAVGWVGEAAELAGRAREKLGRLAERMLLDRRGLEEATHLEVARFRARRFAGFDRVADLGCGVGADLIALAERARVVGVEIDPARAVMAAHNVRAAVPVARAWVVRADLRDRPVCAPAAFADPSRRRAGRRVRLPAFGDPPLEAIRTAYGDTDLLAVKVSPLLGPEELPPEAAAEWISLRGELKECTLWFGGGGAGRCRATALPQGATIEGEPATDLPPPAVAGEALYRIEAAVIKARLVSFLAERTGLAPLDARPAYLTGPCGVRDPFLSCFRILARLPARERALRSALNRLGIGAVVIHKLNFPGSGETLRARVQGRLRGSGTGHVILTLERGEKAAFLVEPISAAWS